MVFQGCATALITPFTKDNRIDFNALGRMIEMQLDGGVKGFVACGTTGEPATMTHDERVSVIRFVIDSVHHRVPVIVGTGSNCTQTAVENSIEATSLGADALLVVTPYYNKCTQKGLVAHYEAIASATSLPVLCYNVPSRTGVNIAPATYDALMKIKNLVAVKEASGNPEQIKEIAQRINGKMALYSGDDDMIVPFYEIGGAGVISVASNIIPRQTAHICELCEKGDFTAARELAARYSNLMKLLFCEVNPIPAKAAASYLGLCENSLRLPLTEIESEHAELLRAEMQRLGLIGE